jgi:hypothetical protein
LITNKKQKGVKKMNKTKNKKYENLFDKIEILDLEFNCDKIKIEYTAQFLDENKSYSGFYYDGCNADPFKDVATSDIGEQERFDSVQEIIDLIPDAIEYHNDTSKVLVERFVSFIDENDDLILFMTVGSRTICI